MADIHVILPDKGGIVVSHRSNWLTKNELINWHFSLYPHHFRVWHFHRHSYARMQLPSVHLTRPKKRKAKNFCLYFNREWPRRFDRRFN